MFVTSATNTDGIAPRHGIAKMRMWCLHMWHIYPHPLLGHKKATCRMSHVMPLGGHRHMSHVTCHALGGQPPLNPHCPETINQLQVAKSSARKLYWCSCPCSIWSVPRRCLSSQRLCISPMAKRYSNMWPLEMRGGGWPDVGLTCRVYLCAPGQAMGTSGNTWQSSSTSRTSRRSLALAAGSAKMAMSTTSLRWWARLQNTVESESSMMLLEGHKCNFTYASLHAKIWLIWASSHSSQWGLLQACFTMRLATIELLRLASQLRRGAVPRVWEACFRVARLCTGCVLDSNR